VTDEIDESVKQRLCSYVANLRKLSDKSEMPRMTVGMFAEKVGVSRSGLYKNYRKEVMEFQKLQSTLNVSSNRKLLLASRRENKVLRERNMILTSVAHEYFIENENLKRKIRSLEHKTIERIK